MESDHNSHGTRVDPLIDRRSKEGSGRPAPSGKAGRPRTPEDAKRALLWVALNPKLVVWNLFVLLISPFLLALKLRRRFKKRANHEFALSRWTIPNHNLSLPGSSHVVFAGASFGEMILVDRLAKALRDERPDLKISWAIRDPQTLAQIRRTRPDQALSAWPFDLLPPTIKWLRIVRPDVVVFVERFSFPTLAVAAKLYGAKVVLVNGRAKMSRLRWLTGAFYRWVLGNYDVLAMQAPAYLERMQELAPQTQVSMTGNVKLDLPKRSLPDEQAEDLERWLLAATDVPLIAAGSTNNEEEERFVMEAFRRLRANAPCRLLLAPRKLERVGDAILIARDFGFSVSYRSKGDPPADVMVLDTMGELAHCYQFCATAYVGGAYNGMGHNIAEPLQWGIPVSYGMRRGHFEDLQRLCEKAAVGFRVPTSDRLAQHWLAVLTDESLRERVSLASVGLFAGETGALQRTVNLLLEVVE